MARLAHYDGEWMTPEERDLRRAQKNASKARSHLSFNFVSDIKEFTTQEGVSITSRSKLRDYERKNGVRQVGNDIPPPKLPGEAR